MTTNPAGRGQSPIRGVKTFCANRYDARAQLGDRVTRWLAEHPDRDLVDVDVVQSSDDTFHCVTIVVWYGERSNSEPEAR